MPEGTDDRSGRGSALAVDLRRARRAKRRAEHAAERAAAPPPSERTAPTIICGDREPIACVRDWFASEGWEPFPFQEEVWHAYLAGESGLIHAATGTGKTHAAWMGPVLEWLRDYPVRKRGGWAGTRLRVDGKRAGSPPLRVLWITPLRALAADTEAALRAPVDFRPRW